MTKSTAWTSSSHSPLGPAVRPVMVVLHAEDVRLHGLLGPG